MDFGETQKPSKNTIIGIGSVTLLHVFLVYALVSGLATSAVQLIKKPLEIKIIQQAPPPPPPPPQVVLPPPPLLAAPPPPYVPPPIIQVQAPPQQVFAVTSAKPAAPQSTAPAKPNTSVSVVCPNVGVVAKKLSDAFQDIADTQGVNSAQVVVQFNVDASGKVSNPAIVSSNYTGVNNLAIAGVEALSCKGQGQDVTVRAPFDFEAN